MANRGEDQKIPVIEMFGPVIQGEGAMIGVQTFFLRTGGCDYDCTMCDSRHAIDQEEIRKRATYMTPEQIGEELLKQMEHTTWVTFSGGNPCLWPLMDVIVYLGTAGKKIAVETQGTAHPSWLNYCDQITISPKGPGMGEKTDFDVLDTFVKSLDCATLRDTCMKVVCFNTEDLMFAEKIALRYPQFPLYLSVGNQHLPGSPLPLTGQRNRLLNDLKWLWEAVSLSHPNLSNAIILPQLHVLVYGNEEGR